MGMVNDFKAFILRGNVVDLAVAVVIGAAFGAVVLSLVSDLLTPLIGAIFGEPDFSGLTFTINDSTFYYGNFINQVFTFLMVAAAVFFFVVIPVNALMERYGKGPPPEPVVKQCPECLSDIPAEARRCAFCTAQLSAA